MHLLLLRPLRHRRHPPRVLRLPGSRRRMLLLLLPSPESNRTFKNAMSRWFLEPEKASKILSGAAARQGVLHVYGSYCDKIAADCASCLVFNSI